MDHCLYLHPQVLLPSLPWLTVSSGYRYLDALQESAEENTLRSAPFLPAF
jgi:hypothetical protein